MAALHITEYGAVLKMEKKYLSKNAMFGLCGLCGWVPALVLFLPQFPMHVSEDTCQSVITPSWPAGLCWDVCVSTEAHVWLSLCARCSLDLSPP